MITLKINRPWQFFVAVKGAASDSRNLLIRNNRLPF